jgi:GT2 family glycosyltransferase
MPDSVVANLLRNWKKIPRRLVQIQTQEGWSGLRRNVTAGLRRVFATYPKWVRKYDTLSQAAHRRMRDEISRWPVRPLISVIMPVYNTDLRWLNAAIGSVQSQLYPDWELCISDDASTRDGVRDMVSDFARRDRRIRANFRHVNGSIAINSNDALSLASGTFIALLDADDVLPQHALYWVAREIIEHPDADLIFSDEDKVNEQGKRFDPYFKPDWNQALMLSQNAFSHLGIYRKSVVERVGGFRSDFDGSQDHDLVLRCALETSPQRIRHIPRILYHWRAISSSVAAKRGMKPGAWPAGRRAIEQHLTQRELRAAVSLAPHLQYQIAYELPAVHPRVSILIPTTGNPALLGKCLDSVLTRTTYENFEVLLLVDEIQKMEPGRAEMLRKCAGLSRVRVLFHSTQDFNYSWVNNWGAREAAGEVLCLLNDDTELITPDWLEKMVARATLPDVGAVGAMLYYPNDTIQHAGVILGLGGIAGHAFCGERRGSGGYFSRACLEQDLSCVTAACLAVRRDVFIALGGFDERFAIAFNDVDFCIRLRQSGLRVIWTPTVELYHHESASAGRHDSPERAHLFAAEKALLRKLWAPVLDADPFYNPNLSLERAYQLAFPPRRPAIAESDGDVRRSLNLPK